MGEDRRGKGKELEGGSTDKRSREGNGQGEIFRE